MLKLSRRTITAVAAVVSLSVGLGAVMAAALAIAAGDQEIVQGLRAGGLVIAVRHGATFPDQADTDPLNFDNIAAQNLNDKGKLLARQFGDALRQAFQSARSTPASITVPMKPQCLPASKASRKRRI
jgi:hypothetical protein